MHEIETAWLSDEVHRFFPEWADRPLSRESFPEFDRNSYMAGGYSEEFGHGAGVESIPHESPSTQEPERCPQWKVQSGGLHPGYPECPRPGDRGRSRSARNVSPVHGGFDIGSSDRSVLGAAERGPEKGMSTIRVGKNNRLRHHGWLTARLVTLWVGIRARRRDLGGIV
jgi:hypothetical protein